MTNAAAYFIVTENECCLHSFPFACKTLEQAQERLAAFLDAEPRAGYRIVLAKASVSK